ncbi:Protein of unknown function [Gryllus bimaculatus]|nr:Protein of unknown function [Gryllus bimaculatus]
MASVPSERRISTFKVPPPYVSGCYLMHQIYFSEPSIEVAQFALNPGYT